MKKSLLIIAVLIGLASCKKEDRTVIIDLTQSTYCTGSQRVITKSVIQFSGTDEEIENYCRALNITTTTTSSGVMCKTTSKAVVR